MSGEGLSKILLLSENLQEQNHFMVERMLRRSGLSKESFYFNTVDGDWYVEAKEKDVRVVVALGERALRASTANHDIKRWRGRVFEHPDYGFYVVPTFKPSKLMHARQVVGAPPDREIMRNPPRYQGRWQRDLHYALEIARSGFTRHPVRYLLDPSPEQFLSWVREFLRAADADPLIKLSVDIETPYKKKKEQEDELEESEQATEVNTTIIRIGFSYVEFEGVSIPYRPEYFEGIRQLLVAPAAKVVWNGLTFDIPVLETVGYTVNGMVFDGMDTMKFWQSDLDRGLEATSADATDVLPWKHLSDAMPAWYNAADADVALRSVNWLLQQIAAQGAKALDSYMETMVKLMPDLREAGARGNTINLDYQADLRKKIEAEQARLEAEIQLVVPDTLRPRHRYKRIPEVIADLVRPEHTAGDIVTSSLTGRRFQAVLEPNPVKVCSNCGKHGVTKGDHTAKKSLGKTLVSEQHHPKKCHGTLVTSDQEWLFQPQCTCPKGWPKKKWDVTPNPCHDAVINIETHPTVEWDEILPFNAGSSQQMIAYMKAHKHPVGVNKDDTDRESADSKHLQTLVNRYGDKHPLYGLAMQKSKVDKAANTYLWTPDEHGRIHQTYVNSPSTLRLGGRAYNLMNVGKRYDPSDPESGNMWSWLARNQIEAEPYHVIVQADSSSVEGVMQGYYMGDEHYMWLANQSIHAWLATKKLGWDFNPDTVKKVKKEHKSLYDAMKVMNYRTNFGGSAFSAWKDNPKDFPTLEVAERTQNDIFTLIPSLEEYQYGVRYQAQKQGYLESPWGHRHYFYDVFTYARDRWGEILRNDRGKPKLKLGRDGKRVVAYFPQHSNAMFLRQNARLIFESRWRRYVPANFLVHDGYTLVVPYRLAEEAQEFLATVLTRPIPEMGGLRVGAEVEVGKNWGSYDPIHNPNGMKGTKKVVIEKQELAWMPSRRAA